MFFSWATPLFAQGASKPLESDEIWNLSDEEKTEHVLAEYYAMRFLIFN
jgi:hypothetical protein